MFRDQALTTTEIAQRAGVSVGSLYGYFDDKWSVLAEVARNKEDWAAGEGVRIADEVSTKNLEQAVGAIVTRILEDALLNRPVRRALNHAIPEAWVSAARTQRTRVFRGLVAAYLERQQGVDPEEARERAFVIVSSVDGIVRAAIADERDRLQDPRFKRRIVALIMTACLPLS